MQWRWTIALLCSALAYAAEASPQAASTRPAEKGDSAPHRMEITVEQRQNGAWKAVDPATVFENGAQVRFRLKTTFPGWLYVMNQGTGGTYLLLFPTSESGENNRIEAGREYYVPQNAGAFKVTGPPGHDIVYWMITPVEMGGGATRRPASAYVPLPPPPPPGTKLSTLVPRCDDAVFRARGECVDSQAGPRKVAKPAELPANLRDVPNLNSRELVFIREKDSAVVSTPGAMKGPVVYEFRLSHK